MKAAPAGFQRWPLVWFCCPSCGFATFASIAQLRPPAARRSVFRFWCQRCERFSLLAGPPWLPAVLALCACGVSLLALLGLLELLPQASDVAVLASFAVFLAAWAGLNRLGNRFAAENAG